jgi:sodium transport system ATP-binding protein
MIKVEQLSKEFTLSRKQMTEIGTQASSLRVLTTSAFECLPGRIFSLLGPNGAEKPPPCALSPRSYRQAEVQ